MKRIARIACVILPAVLLVWSAPLQPSLASEGLTVATPGNPCAPDVETQFRRLKHHGEALGFHLGAGTPVPRVDKHYQGIQRQVGAGVPHFFLSKNGNPLSHTDPSREPGHLLVVRYSSRPTDGERLRSNRLRRGLSTEDTAPPPDDRVVADIAFDQGGLAYHHAGGMQTYGDVLVVPLEKPMGDDLPMGKVVFFDVSDPTAPDYLYEVPMNDHAGAAALTRLPDGRFLLAVGGPNESRNLHTYLSDGTDLHDRYLVFTEYDVWRSAELGSGRWPIEDEAHQTLNFLEQCDGALYLVGTNNDNVFRPDAEDYADLYRVGPIDGTDLSLEWIGRREIYCESKGGTLCNLAAAGGIYVSPGGDLILYGAEHSNNGPGDTVRMGEYRHREMFHFSSPAWAPTADAGGPYVVPEGSSAALDGSGTRLPFAQAWAELYDDATWSDRSVVFDYADRSLENWEELDRLDGFTDKTSSARWASPVGCDIVLYKEDHFDGESYSLLGDGTVRSISGLTYLEVSSARFEGSTCGADDVDLRWDIDGDAQYETAGATATFDASAIDGPWIHQSNLNACGAWLNACDVAPARIEITNVPPSATIHSILDEQGQVVGLDVDWVLQGLDAGLQATFTDPGKPDTHTAAIGWGDGQFEPQGDFDRFGDSTGGVTGAASSSHAYAEPGTYTITLTVTDDDGGVGAATRELRVLSGADALAEVRADLEVVAADPFLTPLAKKHLDRALGKLGGAPGQDGAIDRLRARTLNAALVMIRDALVELVAAEDLQPGLDLAAEKTLITLAAKSVVMGAIASAEGSNTDDARALVTAGDARLSDGDHVGAVDEYRKALTKING